MSERPPLSARLEDGPLFGTFLKLPRPEVVDILAVAGLDFLICDTEHGQVDEADVRSVVLAGRAAGIAVVVRVPELDPGAVNRMLEAGAAGIQLSGVTTAAQTTALSRATRYPPDGARGLSTAQPAAGYGTVPVADYLASSSATVLRVGQLETAAFADPVERIVRDLDVAFIGPMDLSVDLGVPGQLDSPVVQAAIAGIADDVRDAGTPLGIFAPSVPAALAAVEAGFRYVAVGSDLAWLTAAARDLATRIAEVRSTGARHG